MLGYTQAEIEAFRSRLKLDPKTGCLNWTGCTQKPGAKNQLPYAIVRSRGKQMHGHRLAMMMHLNGPIPAGLHVLHSCHNATCCNIEHLRLGTAADNAADKMSAGRHRHPAKGTAIPDADVRSWHEQGLKQADIRNRYGHSPVSIQAAFERVGLPRPFVRHRGKYRPDPDIRHAFSLGGSLAQMARRLGMDPTAFKRRLILLGLAPPTKPPFTDDVATALSQRNLPSITAIALVAGVSRKIVRDTFSRLGLALPRNIGGPPIPDDCHWFAVAAENHDSLRSITIKHGHDARVVRRQFERLGLPIPRGTQGRKKTTPTNPTKGA